MYSRQRGFTLIELLVVIAIIGILSSVVLASLNSARQKGRDARRVSDLKQLQLALELYFDANSSSYPVAANYAALGALITPTYISVLPTDPQGGKSYGYIRPTATTYVLGARLEVVGQTGALSNDNDIAQVLTIDGLATANCNENAGINTEAVYCVAP